MGYSEIYCIICDISFNINRARRLDEPHTAAWSHSGPSGNCFPSNTSYMIQGCKDADSCWTIKSLRQQGQQAPELESTLAKPGPDALSDTDTDPDWIQQEEEDTDSELYEYETPCESDIEMGDQIDSDDDASVETSDSDHLYQQFIEALNPRPVSGPPPLAQDAQDLRPIRDVPLYPENKDDPDNLEAQEHIAGPGCCHEGAYNGHNISVEEMKTSNTFQCLVPKPHWWRPEIDDEQFEIEGRHFLSGLCDHMPSRDWSHPEVWPVRHYCDKPDADNTIWEPSRANTTVFPFHPTCLEVFKRAAVLRRGHVDWKALTDWMGLTAISRGASRIPGHEAAQRGRSQWWRHVPGDEFLAANPCFMPKMADILAAANEKDGQDVGTGYHRDAIPTGTAPSGGESDDAFTLLSYELRMKVLNDLGSEDIASLRLASRTFRQLPQSLFHSLLVKEAPWFWEAWSTMDYSYWATTTAQELLAVDDVWMEKEEEVELIMARCREEGEPFGENQEAITALRAEMVQAQNRRLESRKPRHAPLLPRIETDWYRVFNAVVRSRESIKGLRNRQRIWNDCENILKQIEEFTLEGRMGAGVTVDLVAEAQSHQDLIIGQRQAWSDNSAIVPVESPGIPAGVDFFDPDL